MRNAASNALLWQANAMDAQGHLTQQTYGNGIVTQQVFDAATGRLSQQLAGAGNAVQNMSYTYDSLGNLTTRLDANNNLTETYLYDTLNRVTSATAMSGAVNVTSSFAYDALGNITNKSDVGAYSYNASGLNSVRPHAVANITGTVNGTLNPTFTYDANGNLIAGAGRTVTWSSFNIPSQIVNQTAAGAKTAAFWYNPEHERIKELQADQSVVITLSPRYDTGLHFEKKYIAANGVLTGAVEYEHYLYAGGLMFGKFITVTQTDGITLATTSIEYYSRDHLGSIVAITDGTGTVTQRLSYDVWGKRRYPNGAADPNGLLNNPDMYHGFTGHEMLDAVGLIHMNGRLYDPVMARFVSADPHIQSPDSLQSYNRYTYCMDNPVTCTDPSGYFSLGGFLRAAVAVAAIYYAGPIMQWAGGSALGTATSAAIAQGAVGGALVGYVAGGTLQSTITGGLSGAMFGGIGDFAGGLADKGFTSFANGGIGRAALHAAGGGLMSKAMGGDFMSGAMAAGFAELAGPMTSGLGPIGDGVARMVVGGTASVIGGGKFENGAITAAYGYMFNCSLHKCWDKYLYNGSKMLLGAAGAMGGAAACAGLVSCAAGAPAVAFSLSNVGEGATGIRNLINDTSDGQGKNVLVDGIKVGVASTGASPTVQNLVANAAQVAADLLGVSAPVLLAEKWVIAPSASMTKGLPIRSNVWNTGNKFTNTANVLLDGSGL